MTLKWGLPIAAGVGAALALLTAFAIVGVGGRHDDASEPGSSSVSHDFTAAGIEKGDICPGQVSADGVTELATMSDGHVWMPTAKAASQDTLTSTLMCSGSPTLFFANGVSVTFESGWDLDDPKQRWTDMAHQWGGSVQSILDQPGYVFDLDDKSDDPGVSQVPGATPTSEVLVVVDGTLVRLLGPEVAASELVGIADSIKVEEPVRS